MTSWKISPQEYFQRIDLTIEDFKNELHLPDISRIENIVPLREIKKVHCIIPMQFDLMTHLLRKVETLDGDIPPYIASTFTVMKISPRQLSLGQRYIYREKYISLVENAFEVFSEFPGLDSGLGDMMPCFV